MWTTVDTGTDRWWWLCTDSRHHWFYTE